MLIGSWRCHPVPPQLLLRLATLSLFCNRPTVVALMDLVADINSAPQEVPASPKGAEEEGEAGSGRQHVVKGVLGKGKQRVMFQLALHMEHTQVTLNKEDGRQLAMLTMDKISVVIQIHPSTFSLHAQMGNLRVVDFILGEGHPYGWMCNTRDQKAVSFVKVGTDRPPGGGGRG